MFMDFGKRIVKFKNKIMHDFLLAKEIIDKLESVALEKNILIIKSVDIEIGQVALAHDGHPEHIEDVSVDNLIFGLENIIKKTKFKQVKFNVKKVAGSNWKITNIEV
jgi:Zn finger protein HypA/HybF involved in hydrogenase expression